MKRILSLVCAVSMAVSSASAQELKLRNTLKGHSQAVRSVAFNPNGTILASGSVDNAIRLWNVATGNTTATFNGNTRSVHSVAFSPNGKTLASGGGGNEIIKLWSVTTGKNTATLNGNGQSVLSVAFSPDGKTLASGIQDGTVELWDVKPGE